jgi:hypothetical protein
VAVDAVLGLPPGNGDGLMGGEVLRVHSTFDRDAVFSRAVYLKGKYNSLI